jgi:hypothetical protein
MYSACSGSGLTEMGMGFSVVGETWGSMTGVGD